MLFAAAGGPTLPPTPVLLLRHLRHPQVEFLPFDPTIKRTEGTLRGPDGKTFKCTKGAPHIILKLVQVDQEEVAKRVNWKVRGGDLGLFWGLFEGVRKGG